MRHTSAVSTPALPGRGAEGKTPVVGLIHREEGQVSTTVTKDVKARTIMPIIWNNVPRTTENTIHTDELASYNYVQKLGYTHGVVHHGKGEYASWYQPCEHG